MIVHDPTKKYLAAKSPFMYRGILTYCKIHSTQWPVSGTHKYETNHCISMGESAYMEVTCDACIFAQLKELDDST